MRKRKIWAEGSFAAMKREHNLLKIRKRGILAATEECLLSAMALNLKRMVKAIFSAMLMDKIWAENIISQPIFRLCQQVRSLTSTAMKLMTRPPGDWRPWPPVPMRRA
ncbi:MAG: transposase [Flintibacter sp.]|nr:transposase [Flintibacter sp.]